MLTGSERIKKKPKDPADLAAAAQERQGQNGADQQGGCRRFGDRSNSPDKERSALVNNRPTRGQTAHCRVRETTGGDRVSPACIGYSERIHIDIAVNLEKRSRNGIVYYH